MMIVLNKVDLVEDLPKFTDLLKQSFSKTKFGSEITVCPVSANPKEGPPQGLDDLLIGMLNRIEIPARGDEHQKKDFLFAVDHCFPIKG